LKEILKGGRKKMNGFQEPKGICYCGHTGNGKGSQHQSLLGLEGEGPCIFADCHCGQFIWVRFTISYKKFLKEKTRQEGNTCKKRTR